MIGLALFLSGIVVAKFVAMPEWVLLMAVLSLLGLILIFDDRLVKMVAFWTLMLVVGIGYPELLGREQLVAIDPNSALIRLLTKVRETFLAAVANIFPEPYGAFAQGLTIGERSELPAAIKRDFINTGTLHIVAVSGFNFTILIRLFHDWIRGFGRKRSFIAGTTAIIAFIIITGAQPSVVRAGIMGWLFILASALGRLPNITIALFFTAAIMALLEPGIVTESLSFQLSVLSMLGLIWVEPLVSKLFDSVGWQRYIPKVFRDGLTATLGAQIMTLGLVLAVFGRFSLISPLVNMLIAPFVPLGMILSLVAGVGGVVFNQLGILLAYPAWIFLKIILEIIEFFGRFNLASLRVNPWPWWWAVGYYAIVLVVIWTVSKSKKLPPPQMTNS